MSEIYIYGASGHGKVLADNLISSGQSLAGFIDDDKNKKELVGHAVIDYSSIAPSAKAKLLIGIGNNQRRQKIATQVDNEFANAIHGSSTIASSAKLGEGVAIMAKVVINSDTTVGNHCILNTSASIDHDCQIGDFVHIAPGAILCGGIEIGEGTLIGAGAVVLPNIKVGAWAIIGAGSVVTKDIPAGVTVTGNPAKPVIS